LDIVSRRLGVQMSASWGQPVIIDNRPGAGSNIGSEIVARAAPDGYTLLMGGIANATNPGLYKNMGYDPVKDFEAVSLVASVPGIIVSHPSLPVRTLRDLISLARARPGQLSYASTGAGGPHHLGGELFSRMAGIRMLHVPYKGASPALNDVMGGQVPLMFGNLLSVLPQVNAKKLNGLAVTSTSRASAAPDLPTVAELALPGYEYGSWMGVLVPAGTPRDIVVKLSREIVGILKSPEMTERLNKEGADVRASTPEEFAAYMKREIAKWAKVVKESGIRLD
jgi:tripartite-type tricarboxylate transporter receptor subunit TctC